MALTKAAIILLLCRSVPTASRLHLSVGLVDHGEGRLGRLGRLGVVRTVALVTTTGGASGRLRAGLVKTTLELLQLLSLHLDPGEETASGWLASTMACVC